MNLKEDLNVLVAKYVFGLEITDGEKPQIAEKEKAFFEEHCDRCFYNGLRKQQQIPAFSTNMSDAWMIVNELKGTEFTLKRNSQNNHWIATFSDVSFERETPMLAICIAALALKKVEIGFI